MGSVPVACISGEKKVTEITTADVELFGQMLIDDGLSSKSVLNILGFLHSVFEYGIDRGVEDRQTRVNGDRFNRPARRNHLRT